MFVYQGCPTLENFGNLAAGPPQIERACHSATTARWKRRAISALQNALWGQHGPREVLEILIYKANAGRLRCSLRRYLPQRAAEALQIFSHDHIEEERFQHLRKYEKTRRLRSYAVGRQAKRGLRADAAKTDNECVDNLRMTAEMQ